MKREDAYEESYGKDYDEDEIIPIDKSVIPIVDYINSWDTFEVVGSCGGHKDHKSYQAHEGFFYVDFIGDFGEVGYFVNYLSGCEGHCLEVVIKSTIFSEIFYRLQGNLENAIDILIVD
jgi:hypothetical protein